MSLAERIDRRQDTITPLIERRGGTEQRIPAWVKRAQAGKLAGKDLSGQVAA